MGVNIHSAFGGNFITNPQGVANVLNDIGFRYVRDIPTTPDRLNALTAATGVKVCVITQYYYFDSDAFNVINFDATWDQVKHVNNIAYLELPNEPQNFDPYEDKLRAWTIKMYQTAKADPATANIPIIGCSLYHPTPALADLNPYLDYGNIHDYPLIYDAGTPIATQIGYARSITGDKPIIATETGYNNAYLSPNFYRGISEIASAKYLPRLYFEQYNAGISKTFVYELINSFNDDTYTNAEAHFGLVRADLSYKPAAYALKNLISLLKDPGPDFTPAPLKYAITTTSADLQHTLLQKRDGTFWLALWRRVLDYDPVARLDLVVDPVNVGLSFNGVPLVRADTYCPATSTDISASATATQLLNIPVSDQVALLHLRLAAPGDTNADGMINNTDVGVFFRHYGQSVTPENGWALGDFNRDGEVGFIDFQLMELNYGRANYSPDLQAEAAAMIAASVPEPGALVAVTMLVTLQVCRRRMRLRPVVSR
jgi:hypothetical protein